MGRRRRGGGTDGATGHRAHGAGGGVQRALQVAWTGRESLVIAHRRSTVRNADLILVLEAGRIVEHGTHDELLRAGGLYAELYDLQASQYR